MSRYQGYDFNLDLTGFDVAEIEELLALPAAEDEDLAPPLPAVPTSRSRNRLPARRLLPEKPARRFRRHQRRPTAEERIVYPFPAPGVIHNRPPHQFQRLLR